MASEASLAFATFCGRCDHCGLCDVCGVCGLCGLGPSDLGLVAFYGLVYKRECLALQC